MIGTHFSKNGALLPVKQAIVPINNIEFIYGFGVYENLKLRNNILYFARMHIERLLHSARFISLEHCFIEEHINQYINELIKKNGIKTANIKILLLGARKPQDAAIYIFLLNPKFTDRKLYKTGAEVLSVKYERQFPQAKTLNMLGSYLAHTKAREENCYDAILIDNRGNALESTRTNFFAIKDKILYTAPKERILNGVTRQTVIHTAIENGYKVKEKLVQYKNLSSYDGAFLTSTSSKILPLSKIDGITLEIPENLKKLIALYNGFLKNSNGIF